MEHGRAHAEVVAFLSASDTTSAQVCRTAPAVVMDWSVGAPPQLLPDPPAVGIGRYLEDRAVYTSAAYATEDPAERRTIHLGIDVFLPAGEAVQVPFDGVIVDVDDRSAPRDFGPVVLVEHHTPAGTPFFTLFGHLSRASIAGRRPGQDVRAGEQLATVGVREENGGWLPHLHLQLLLSHLGAGTGVWGVAPRSQLDRWRTLCPDPNLILRIPELRPAQ